MAGELMFYTVTFNPCIDYVVRVDSLKMGETNRASSEELQFGGKGINVSYILKQLGIESVALGFSAGFVGEALLRHLCEAGLKSDFVRLKKGNTRINVKLKGENETEINANGPEISDDELTELLLKLDKVTAGDTVILSGSVPKGVDTDIYAKIAEIVWNKGADTVVDATGELLLNTLKFRPLLIKPNKSELEALNGKRLESVEQIVEAARDLQKKGAKNVLVSLGSDGALLVAETGEILCEKALGGKPVNTVGAGDSMLAGFLSELNNGFYSALRMGLAAGGATACSLTLATRDEILKLFNN